MEKLTDCGKKGPRAFQPVSYDLAFSIQESFEHDTLDGLTD